MTTESSGRRDNAVQAPTKETGVPSASRPRGRHAGLSAQTIVDTAIRIADQEGISGLSMRKIGAELEVEAMALYHHFSNKAKLFDAIVERLVTSVPLVDLAKSTWGEGLKTYARAQLDALSEHPNLVELVMVRPAVTRGNLALLETLLDYLASAGFPPRRALDMVYTINEVVVMHAALEVSPGRQGKRGESVGHDANDAPEPSPADQDQDLKGEAKQTAQLSGISAENYPRLAEAAQCGRHRFHRARFEFALDALVVGFAAVHSDDQ